MNNNKQRIEFWLSNIFTLVGTLWGVYLAANSGFEKALEFEGLQHQRDAYYVQSALYNELNNNLDLIKSWTDSFNEDPQGNDMHIEKDDYRLNYFFWETMQEGDAIFEVPYQKVEKILSFYMQADSLKNKMLSGNPFEAPGAADKLAKFEQKYRSEFMPSFKAELDKLENDLAGKGVIVSNN